MDKNQAYDFDFKYILRTIVSKWYIIILMAVLGLAFSFYKGYNKTTTIYQATTSLIVGNAIDGEGTKYEIKDVKLYEGFTKIYCSLAKTRMIAEKVAKKLNKGITPEQIQNIISVTTQENTQFIDVWIKWNNPKDAVIIMNTFSEVFINEAKSIYPTCNIQVIEKTKNPESIIISKRKYVMLAPLVGAILGILIIFGIDLLDKTIRTEEDVKEYLNSSVIGEIPKDKKMIDSINSELVKNLNFVIMEAFRTIRTKIEFVASSNNLKSIMVTSAKTGEGKTIIASMLAYVIAQTGKKTILVDCDLRNPNIHKRFRITNEVGLSNYLEGKVLLSEAVTQSSIDNLYIITSGRKPSNPAELLSSSSMKSLMRVLRNEYDFIIFDTSPVGLVTDTQILSQIVDSSVLVVSSGKSIKKDVVKAKELIRQVGGNIIGVTLNNVKYPAAYKKYSSYYQGNKKKQKKVVLPHRIINRIKDKVIQ